METSKFLKEAVISHADFSKKVKFTDLMQGLHDLGLTTLGPEFSLRK